MIDDKRSIQMCDQHDGQLVAFACAGCGRPLCALCHRFEIAMRPWCPACARPHLPDEVTERSVTVFKAVAIGAGVAAVLGASVISPLAVIIALGVVGLGLAALFARSRPPMDIRELKDGRVVKQLR